MNCLKNTVISCLVFSYNYHFHSIKQGGRIRWNIEGGSQLNISFNVKEDIKAGIDKEIFKGLKDGSETNMPAGDSIYIADVKQNGEDIKDSHLLNYSCFLIV